VPQLDALRGLAILWVIAHNTTEKFGTVGWLHPLLDRGWVGVELFFALSGFLITGILLDTKGSAGYFGNFYARRVLRILPLYYTVLVIMFLVLPRLSAAEGASVFEKSSPWWAFPLFLQNFLLPLSTKAAGPLGVTWSLAIEEQFYLVWPLVVWCLSPRRLAALAILDVVLSPFVRFYLSIHGASLYVNIFSRLDGLMLGALIAISVRRENFRTEKFVALAGWIFCVATPLAILTDLMGLGWIMYSFAALASGAVLYLILFWNVQWLQLVLSNRLLLFAGTISYGLYLLHKFSFATVGALHIDGGKHPLVALALVILTSYPLALLSWIVLERPALRLKKYFSATHPQQSPNA
jgi:peptidoglycan/LPS O-acetylase OafA/YrhL